MIGGVSKTNTAVVSHQAQVTLALCSAPSNPLLPMLGVLGWSAEDQPLTLDIGAHQVIDCNTPVRCALKTALGLGPLKLVHRRWAVAELYSRPRG
jgi:hypothetical protein